MSPACVGSGCGYLIQVRTSFGVNVAGHQKRVITSASMTRESLACSDLRARRPSPTTT